VENGPPATCQSNVKRNAYIRVALTFRGGYEEEWPRAVVPGTENERPSILTEGGSQRVALGASNWPANQVAAGLKLREPVAEAGTGMVFSTIARAASEVVVLHFSQDITNRAAAGRFLLEAAWDMPPPLGRHWGGLQKPRSTTGGGARPLGNGRLVSSFSPVQLSKS
jgi:hypothetical protein